MSQGDSQDNVDQNLDVLGKEIHPQKPNTRSVSLDFQKLHKFGKHAGENSIVKGANSLKSTSKTPCVRHEELLEWVRSHNSNISSEKEILFHSKQNV